MVSLAFIHIVYLNEKIYTMLDCIEHMILKLLQRQFSSWVNLRGGLPFQIDISQKIGEKNGMNLVAEIAHEQSCLIHT